MRSEKVILLRHLVALLAASSASSWIQFAHGLEFSPINEITLGTEVTIDWTGQPSLGNVEQSVVLMKDGNALLTLCQGQVTGSGQCSFDLKEEHQVLGDGYQLAMQGMDGVALDYSAEFSIKAGDVKVESSSGGGEEDVEEKEDEDEDEIEPVEDKDDGEDEDNDKEEQVDGDDVDAKVEKERTGHDDNEDADDGDDGGVKKKKDKKKIHGYQKSQVHKQKVKDNKQQQQQHHNNNNNNNNNKQQQNKKKPKQKKQQLRQKDGYNKHQVDKLVKTFQQQQKEQHQNRFTVMSTGSREQRAKEAARLLEKNRHRRQMLLVARRHQYLRMRQQAIGLQESINSIFDQLAPPMAHAAEPPRARVVVSASNDADESNKDSNVGIGINPVLGNDAHVELMPERPIQKAATGAVAGGTDEIDMELADGQEHRPDKKDTMDKEEKDPKAETKDEAEQGTWSKILGGIAMFGKNVGATVADGFTKVQHVIVGGGADAPEGELKQLSLHYSFKHKYAIAGGYRYHFAEEGNPTGPVLLQIHGFSDLWYGRRRQIKVFAEKGYRVIAIDCLGYGETPREFLKGIYESSLTTTEQAKHPTRDKNMSYSVYLIKGENDPVLVPELAATMSYLYKNYSTLSIQTGHFAMLEKLQEFNKVLEGILTTIHQ
ncbi:hypothetical protein BGX30_014939 [Mortierella sp. GBA39]|nr:hypothetical protein BGX30_014939 [Mortierella sp. GBA39]